MGLLVPVAGITAPGHHTDVRPRPGCDTDDAGERHWVKFHLKTQQGHKFHTNQEAEKAVGRTRGAYQAAQFNTIENGEFPRWTMQVQIMLELDADKTPYNPFGLTKV